MLGIAPPSSTSARKVSTAASSPAIYHNGPACYLFVKVSPTKCHSQVESHYILLGPYAPAILRFEVVFPSSYPKGPPVIRFTSDIFHPLVTPLTTYTYSTSASSNSTISASDEECLPPGGFSLNHGFPSWVQKPEPSVTFSNPPSGYDNGSYQELLHALEPRHSSLASPSRIFAQDLSSQTWRGQHHKTEKSDSRVVHNNIVNVLEYMKESFDDAESLDKIPAGAARNPGAWKAWQAHRKQILDTSNEIQGALQTQDSRHLRKTPHTVTTSRKPRHPEDWNWDGVWQERVRHGINTSISDPVLYGTGVGDDPVRPYAPFHMT